MLLHRFSSPAWLEHVAKHVSADMSSEEALDRIVRLQVRFLLPMLLSKGLIFRQFS